MAINNLIVVPMSGGQKIEGDALTVTTSSSSPLGVGIKPDTGIGILKNGKFTAGSTGNFNFVFPAGTQYLEFQASADIVYDVMLTATSNSLVAPTALSATVTDPANYGSGNIAIANQKVTRIPVTTAQKLAVYCTTGTVIYLNFTGA